jgi:glutamate synthase domain-containing protein 3
MHSSWLGPAVGDDSARDEPAASILVAELRDYHQVNAEISRLLNLGQRHIRLEAVAGQRLLAAGLAGPWRALIEVDGDSGPELAAGMKCPEITLVCRGAAADGAGEGLRAGTLIIMGTSGTAVAYVQEGGTIVACGDAGPRAGLGKKGGDLVLLGTVGSLAGERQSGGRLFYLTGQAGPHLGRAARGGQFIEFDSSLADLGVPSSEQRSAIAKAIELARTFASPA